MAPIKPFDRCCNPFKIESHLKKKGLRRATDMMNVTLGLDGNYLLCSSCRKDASKFVEEQTTTSDDFNVDPSYHENNCSDNNENNNQTDSDTTTNTTATDHGDLSRTAILIIP